MSMIITIVGWYGTETIGDRAILFGIINILKETFNDISIELGSLFPFFTNRTINEDYEIWKEIDGKDISINLFDLNKKEELVGAIRKSDVVMMAGGPLMNIGNMFMIEYAFRKAKKYGKKTALLGCGIGPIYKKKYKKNLYEIIRRSDVTIVRDMVSKKNYEEIFKEIGVDYKKYQVYKSIDPSIKCCITYIKKYRKKVDKLGDYCVINVRKYPIGYSHKKTDYNEIIIDIVNKIVKNNSGIPCLLLPMHYFHVGGDDRLFQNEIALRLKNENVEVQNKHLNLIQTLKVNASAYKCYAMRYHAVVFQTILNGNNYIIDYTDPIKGKINGFLENIEGCEFYRNRMVKLQENEKVIGGEDEIEKKYLPNLKQLNHELDVYRKKLIETMQ